MGQTPVSSTLSGDTGLWGAFIPITALTCQFADP
jgi:hypothetical protein